MDEGSEGSRGPSKRWLLSYVTPYHNIPFHVMSSHIIECRSKHHTILFWIHRVMVQSMILYSKSCVVDVSTTLKASSHLPSSLALSPTTLTPSSSHDHYHSTNCRCYERERWQAKTVRIQSSSGRQRCKGRQRPWICHRYGFHTALLYQAYTKSITYTSCLSYTVYTYTSMCSNSQRSVNLLHLHAT